MIMQNIINIIYMKLLLIFCVISIAQASLFYDLNEGIICTLDPSSVSYTKNACIVSEDYQFPPQFLEQTQNMMARESLFREKCNIAGGTNVAQLCIYGTYRDRPGWKLVETFDPRKCKGHFYLSGNAPVLIQNAKEVRGVSAAAIHVQTVGQDKGGYIEVRQRPQPLLATIQETVQFLGSIDEFVEDSELQTQELVAQAEAKHQEIRSLIDKRNGIVCRLRQEVVQLSDLPTTTDRISLSTYKCITGILNELIMCLEGNDFSFNGLKDTKNNEDIKGLIDSIQSELSARSLGDLFNSKFFNLGCSEPLLLFDLMRNDLDRADLIARMKDSLFSDQLAGIVIQLHSTKTPCRSCLIGCCGHCKRGVIRGFFDEIMRELGTIELRFIISYQSPYEDRYPFKIPMIRDLIFSPDHIALVNMQFYDERFRKMKERNVKEERLRVRNLLLAKLKEGADTLSVIELQSLGLI